MGSCSVYYESYCLPIQDICNDLSIKNPETSNSGSTIFSKNLKGMLHSSVFI